MLDNDTTDGSTDRDGFVRVPAPRDRVDHDLDGRDPRRPSSTSCSSRYDVVLVTDVDEILAPMPEWGTLGAYIDRLDEEFVNPLGYEVLHLPDREPPLDLDRPILDQRGYWFANDAYDKPVLATVPMTWVPGFHARADGRHNYDPDLRLIHLHRMDYEHLSRPPPPSARTRLERARPRRGLGPYNRLAEERASSTAGSTTDTGFEDRGDPHRPASRSRLRGGGCCEPAPRAGIAGRRRLQRGAERELASRRRPRPPSTGSA